MKLDPCLTSHTKINSNWITYLNIRPNSVKLLGKNIGGKPLDIGLGNDFFFEMTPKVQATKAKINKGDYIKLKWFSTAKETTK